MPVLGYQYHKWSTWTIVQVCRSVSLYCNIIKWLQVLWADMCCASSSILWFDHQKLFALFCANFCSRRNHMLSQGRLELPETGGWSWCQKAIQGSLQRHQQPRLLWAGAIFRLETDQGQFKIYHSRWSWLMQQMLSASTSNFFKSHLRILVTLRLHQEVLATSSYLFIRLFCTYLFTLCMPMWGVWVLKNSILPVQSVPVEAYPPKLKRKRS
jgi:hypothetical protein